MLTNFGKIIYSSNIIIRLMEKEDMLKEIRRILHKGGFDIGEPIRKTIIFDLIARKNRKILIMKTLVNMDSLRNEIARELKILGSELNASPLIIGQRGGMGAILDGVVYSRHGIPIISLGTFRDFIIEGIPPAVYAAPGGFYVNINSSLLREVRERMGISLGRLAAVAGVTRKTIQLYEEGMSSNVEIALKLEKFLNTELILPIDIFDFGKIEEERYEIKDLKHGEIYRRLMEMGFDVFVTYKCPFEALSKDERDIMLTGIEKKESNLKYKAMNLRILSKILEKRGFIVIEESKYEDYHGIALIKKREIMEREKDEIRELVEERSSI